MSTHLILLFLALILAICASIGIPIGRLNLLAAAFACFIASLLV